MDLFALDRLASPRAGVVARAELRAAGWSEGRITHAVRTGALLRVRRGVYRLAGVPWTRPAAFHAAILAVGGQAHLARWSAAELHRFAEPRSAPVDVLLPHRRTHGGGPNGLFRIRRTRDLPEVDRAMCAGLPVTAPARTLLDLAATTSATRLAEHVAAAVRARACGLEDLHQVVERRRNACGRGRLREVLRLLGDDGADARSDVEVAALRELARAGLPRPKVAFRVHDVRGRFLAEVDLAYPELRLAIEIDGYRWHSTPGQKRVDEERQNRLVLAGWTVLRFSATEVRRHPDRIAAAVGQALARLTPNVRSDVRFGATPTGLTPTGLTPTGLTPTGPTPTGTAHVRPDVTRDGS